MNQFQELSTEELQLQLKAAKRYAAAKAARDSLMAFTRFTMPDPEDIDDADRTVYQETPQGRLLCEVLEKVERGELKRVAVSIGPQLGKSELISRRYPAWAAGRNPHAHFILGSYNQQFAEEFGGEVREIARSPAYQQVFPGFEFRKGSESRSLLVTRQGGKMAFVGVGGSGTGKPADRFVVDDPIRNDEDVQSDSFREKLWLWFNRVTFSRLHSRSSVAIVHTRWHEDDLIGRLCDPDHPERNKRYKGIAKRWTYINIPAVIDDPDLAKALGLTLTEPTDPEVVEQFGAKPIAALWESRKGLAFLAEARKMDSKGFDSLYMGKPSPDDGDYFKSEMIVEYDADELPDNLRKYGASDHAVTEKAKNDENVIGCVGIDEDDNIWVLPDLVIERMEADGIVETLLDQMQRHRPLMWWLENENIAKSFGPFLKKRMGETHTYTMLDPITPSKDLMMRARSIQGRMSHKKVYFPAFASWWPKAKAQLLKFPNATHDDFVAFMALVGLGLTKEIAAAPGKEPEKVIRVGSVRWLKAAAERDERHRESRKAAAGW